MSGTQKVMRKWLLLLIKLLACTLMGNVLKEQRSQEYGKGENDMQRAKSTYYQKIKLPRETKYFSYLVSKMPVSSGILRSLGNWSQKPPNRVRGTAWEKPAL